MKEASLDKKKIKNGKTGEGKKKKKSMKVSSEVVSFGFVSLVAL